MQLVCQTVNASMTKAGSLGSDLSFSPDCSATLQGRELMADINPCLPPTSSGNSFVSCASSVSSAKLTVDYIYILVESCLHSTPRYLYHTQVAVRKGPKAHRNRDIQASQASSIHKMDTCSGDQDHITSWEMLLQKLTASLTSESRSSETTSNPSLLTGRMDLIHSISVCGGIELERYPLRLTQESSSKKSPRELQQFQKWEAKVDRKDSPSLDLHSSLRNQTFFFKRLDICLRMHWNNSWHILPAAQHS